MKAEQLKFGFSKGIERKLEIPKRFWNAWNTAKKISENDRRYQPGIDFAYANGKEAKKVLSERFPNEAKEIQNLTANQAMKAYFDIRGVYFG